MNRWVVRALIIIFVISVYSASGLLAKAMVAFAAVGAVFLLLAKANYLPRFIMDVLDRLSDKGQLERELQERNSQLTLIDAAELARALRGKVVGQDEVIDQVATQLRRRLAARRPEKPLAVFCFAGPAGVGKTHLAKCLTSELFGDRKHLHFFDMSQFSQPHAAASLFGQARGYVGSQSYGSLTAALRDVPDSIVLLDEFEKAHPEVHKRFLTAWNDGFVTETSDGARVSTRDAIFVLTTNAAARRIGELVGEHKGNAEQLDQVIKKALLDAQFAPEVLSRIDQVFAFRPLAGLDIARVFALEIELLTASYGLELAANGIDHKLLARAVNIENARAGGGVRDIARSVEREIGDGLIEARAAGATTVRVVDNNGQMKVVFDQQKPPAQRAVAAAVS